MNFSDFVDEVGADELSGFLARQVCANAGHDFGANGKLLVEESRKVGVVHPNAVRSLEAIRPGACLN